VYATMSTLPAVFEQITNSPPLRQVLQNWWPNSRQTMTKRVHSSLNGALTYVFANPFVGEFGMLTHRADCLPYSQTWRHVGTSDSFPRDVSQIKSEAT